MNECAPGRYDKNYNTCFSIEQLIEMAKAYNTYIRKNRSFFNLEPIDVKKDKGYLLNQFKNRFDKVCSDDEACISRQEFMNQIVKEMKYDILNNTFRPEGPVSSNEWLSTDHINQIMMQYENIYPEFKFLGAVPSDCDKLNFCSLYQIDYHKYQHKYNYLAIIFNLDEYGQSGSHWVALFIDLKRKAIYYNDSTGKEPINNILNVINRFKHYYKERGFDVVYKYNNRAYQKDKSECGIYSCNFIIRMLDGQSFEEIIANPLEFHQINSCRNVYFRNKSSQYSPDNRCDIKF